MPPLTHPLAPVQLVLVALLVLSVGTGVALTPRRAIAFNAAFVGAGTLTDGLCDVLGMPPGVVRLACAVAGGYVLAVALALALSVRPR